MNSFPASASPLIQALQANEASAIQAQCRAIVEALGTPTQEHAFFTQVSHVSHHIALELKIEENLRRERGMEPVGAPSAAVQYDRYQVAMTAACAERMGPAGLSEPQAKALDMALVSQRRHAQEASPKVKAAAKTLGEALGLKSTEPAAPPTLSERLSVRPR